MDEKWNQFALSSLTFQGSYFPRRMWRTVFLRPLPADDSRWATPKGHLEMLRLSQVRAHVKYGPEARLTQLPFLLSR